MTSSSKHAIVPSKLTSYTLLQHHGMGKGSWRAVVPCSLLCSSILYARRRAGQNHISKFWERVYRCCTVRGLSNYHSYRALRSQKSRAANKHCPIGTGPSSHCHRDTATIDDSGAARCSLMLLLVLHTCYICLMVVQVTLDVSRSGLDHGSSILCVTWVSKARKYFHYLCFLPQRSIRARSQSDTQFISQGVPPPAVRTTAYRTLSCVNHGV
jgi:hypothetical protein